MKEVLPSISCMAQRHQKLQVINCFAHTTPYLQHLGMRKWHTGLWPMGGSVVKAAIRSLPLERSALSLCTSAMLQWDPFMLHLLPSPALQLISSSSVNKTLV